MFYCRTRAYVLDHAREIAAHADVVWSVLTDFDAYGEWNPMAVRVECDLRPGGAIAMRVVLRPGKPMKQVEFVNWVTEGVGFSYSMKPAPGGLLRSLRDQRIEDLGGGRSRYTSDFRIDGPLSPVVSVLLGANLRRGFDGAVAGLVARAEQLAG